MNRSMVRFLKFQAAFAFIVLTNFGIFMAYDQFSVLISKENGSLSGNQGNTAHILDTNPVEDEGIIFDYCKLPELDPWDQSIRYLLDPSFVPYQNCTPGKLVTKLENGRIYSSNLGKDVECRWRCLYPVSDAVSKSGQWEVITNGTEIPCDIVETACYDLTIGYYHQITDFDAMHSQIYRPKNETSSFKTTEQPPDVHIIILDAVSYSEITRTMPKTQYVLRTYYDAVPFRHLNKIGHNSRPNGVALLLGKNLHTIEKSPTSVGHESDFKNHSDCTAPIDNEQFIGYEFKKAGYKTMMSEDWAMGIFQWPDCVGFQKTPVDHTWKPYAMKLNFPDSNRMFDNLYKKMCKSCYITQMEFLQDFIDKYPDEPKFSITWNTHTHDDINVPYSSDEFFYNFFKKNIAKFENAYVFFMSDHGMHVGELPHTIIGQVETRNPFLFMTIPKNLRNEEKTQTMLRKNSKELLTHYDLYATFVDIIQSTNASIPTPSVMKGTSVFKQLPQPRSCDRLGVPFDYCICDFEKTPLPNDAEPSRIAAEKMIDQINVIIKREADLTEQCVALSLNTTMPIQIHRLPQENNITIYQLTFAVVPGNGVFLGHAGARTNDNNIFVLSDKFIRLGTYAKTAYCATKSAFAAFCYCKQQLIEEANNHTVSSVIEKSNTII